MGLFNHRGVNICIFLSPDDLGRYSDLYSYPNCLDDMRLLLSGDISYYEQVHIIKLIEMMHINNIFSGTCVTDLYSCLVGNREITAQKIEGMKNTSL